MVLITQIFLFIALGIAIVTESITLYALYMYERKEAMYALLVLSIAIILINIISLIVIRISKKKQYRCKYFLLVNILELLLGGIVPGIVMLFLKDNDFINDDISGSISYNRDFDNVDNYVFKEYVCPHCGKPIKTMDKICSECGCVLIAEKTDNKVEIKEKKILTKEEMKGISLAVNYEKNRLKNILDDQYLKKIEFDDHVYNGYDCNLKSFDLINDKIVECFINVKTYVEEDIFKVFSLSKEEINLLRFHPNFKIYYIYDVLGKKMIRPVTHDNYSKYVLDEVKDDIEPLKVEEEK